MARDVLTVEEVKALQVGETVRVIKEGCEPVFCTVAFRGEPSRKFLTYRVNGEIRRFAIREYPGMRYDKCRKEVRRCRR